MSLIDISNISLTYHSLKGETKAIENVNFSIEKGEFVSIIGPSGCGKSTLLNIISGLLKPSDGKIIYILKGLHIRIIADSQEEDLIKVDDSFAGDKDRSFDSKVNDIIKKVLLNREKQSSREMMRGAEQLKESRSEKENGLVFGRPGRILHIDGDPTYMETCLKVYKQLNLNAVGVAIAEREQPLKILSLVKEYNPDIVVLTGHDGVLKDSKGMLDLNNYRNSKYFIDSVKI